MDYKTAFDIFERRMHCDLCLRSDDEFCKQCAYGTEISYGDLVIMYSFIEKALEKFREIQGDRRFLI